MLELSQTLESQWTRILANLMVPEMPPVVVKVWQDREEFEEAFLDGAAPDETAGNTQGYADIENREVRVFNYGGGAGLTAVHEFTHLVSLQIKPAINNNPRWLWEAVAIHESGRPRAEDRTTLRCVSADYLPSLESLDSHPFNIYRIGYYLAEYLLENSSRSDYYELIKSGGDLEHSLGVTSQELHAGWLDYMVSRYEIRYSEEFPAQRDC